MIGVARGVSVYAYAKPCDMRKSFNTLAALIAEEIKHDLLTGDLYLFVGRDLKRAKVLYFDGTGLCLFSKRLEKGKFSALWRRARGNSLELTLSELGLFIPRGLSKVGGTCLLVARFGPWRADRGVLRLELPTN